MHRQTEISTSSPYAAASPSSMDTVPSPWDSRDEILWKWRARASAPVFHAKVKRPSRRLERNLQLAAQLLLSALAVAFVLLRCYRQVVVVNSPGKEPVRSLAEGEGSGRELPCWGAALEGNQPLAGASDDDFERAMQQRTEDVVRRLVQVTKDFSSVAVLLPAPHSLKAINLFMGLCIQEAAALSSLLGMQFEEHKAEIIQTAIEASQYVKENCPKDGKKATKEQNMQVSRLKKLAKKVWDDDPNGSPLTNEMRMTMLNDLLILQGKALELLEAEISSVLQLQRPVTQLAEELADEILERLKCTIYTRRTQVFRSKHLSSSLRSHEAKHHRAVLVFLSTIRNLDAEPPKTLEEQLAELALGESWVAQSFEQTPKSSSTAPDPELGFPARQREAPARQPTVTRGVKGSKASSGPNNRGREVPPRFKRQKRGFTGKSQETESQDSLTKTGTTLPTQGDPMPAGLYPSYKAKPLQASHAPPHQAPPSTEPPGPPFPELEITVSKQTLGPTGPTPPWSSRSSSGLASTSSLTTRSQPAVPAEEETLEATGLRRQTEMRFGVPKEAPTWPWSSTWSPYSPLLPGPHQAFGRPAYMAGTVEGASSHQAPQNQVGQVWTPISQHSSPSSSFPFTDPQSIAAAAVALLYSSGSQSPPAESHKIARPQTTSTLAGSSGSTLSSLMKGQTGQPMGFPSSSAPSRRPADLHSVEQGVGGSKDSMQGPAGPRSAVSSLLGVQMQEPHQDVLEESPWLDSDSDSG